MTGTLSVTRQLVATVPVPCAGGAYTLPAATPTVLGGVKIGANISVTSDGTISVAPPGTGGSGSQTPWTSDIDCAGYRLTAATGVAISFVQAGTLRMSVNAGGYVSIGKTFASYPLDVAGDIGCSGVYRVNGVPIAAANVVNAVDQSASYANPAWITSFAWSKITGAPADAVPSVFGRTGAVTAQSGDYTAAQVTNAVDKTQTYSNPAWITAIAWGIISGAPTFQQNPAIADELQGGYRTLNSGNVGVGNSLATAPMTSPGTYVQVGSDSGVTPGRVMVCANQPASLQIIGELDFVNFASASAEKRIAYIQGNSYLTAGTSGYLSFFTANAGAPAERMRIGQSGAVSLGSSIGGVDFLTVFSNTVNQGLLVQCNVSGGGSISLRSTGSINYIQSGNQTNASAQDLQIANWNHSTSWMTFQASTGNVGIGTTAPGTTLSVVQSTTYSSPAPGTASGGFSLLASGGLYGLYAGVAGSGSIWLQSMRNDASSTTYNILLNPSGGNVGVGSTLTPSYPLTVIGLMASTGGGAGVVCGDRAGTNTWIVYGTGNGLRFNETSGDRVTIATGGNVGIGTTSPGAVLDVNGSIISRGGGSFTAAANMCAVGFSGGIAQIVGYGPNATTCGQIQLIVIHSDGTGPVYALTVGATGTIAMSALPSTNPGAGTKQLWYDTTDSNRVKFAA